MRRILLLQSAHHSASLMRPSPAMQTRSRLNGTPGTDTASRARAGRRRVPAPVRSGAGRQHGGATGHGDSRRTTGHGDSRRTTCAGLCLHALRALLAGSACSACYHACQASMQRACRLLRQSFSHGWGVQLRALYLIAEASIALHGSCGCLRPDAALLVRYAGYASQVWSAVQHGTPLRRLSRFRLWLTHAGLAQVDTCSSRSA